MGKISNTVNYYFSDNRRFADLFNVVFFEGRQMVDAGELSEVSEVYHQLEAEKPKTGSRGRRLERIHDVCKTHKKGGMLRILALENQNLVDYTMPYRCMQYDTMEYGKQLDSIRRRNEEGKCLITESEILSGILKDDRLAPVYTLCLYHGEKKWDGPRSLRDMMYFAGGEDCFQELFNDYPLRLYCLNEAEDFELFRTEVGQLFRAMQYRGDRVGLKQLLEKDPNYQHLDKDTLEAMSVLLKLPAAWEKRNKIVSISGERKEYDMCQAVIEWEAEAKRTGREEGKNLNLIELVQRKLRKGKTPATIAEDFEEPLENIERICAAVGKCGLEADSMEIYEQLSEWHFVSTE